jgi:hypothetical protein
VAYEDAFYYIVLGVVFLVVTGAILFIWRANRTPEAGGSDSDRK